MVKLIYKFNVISRKEDGAWTIDGSDVGPCQKVPILNIYNINPSTTTYTSTNLFRQKMDMNLQIFFIMPILFLYHILGRTWCKIWSLQCSSRDRDIVKMSKSVPLHWSINRQKKKQFSTCDMPIPKSIFCLFLSM